jgi:hypothetical protein
MINYRRINNLTGWAVFLIAAVTYLLTMESTASLWDCGEFIASGYKLEVGHPPGAPIFMLMGRFFSLFAGGDVTRVAFAVNGLSAMASAFTILFLFWSVTHFARRLTVGDGKVNTLPNTIAIMASGVVGALTYTFSDTFWFSAVEAEVYATSSLYTAVVFWAILRWEESFGDEHADKWLILIAYLMGLSLGVHLLNLLVIPAITFVYYFKKYPFSWKGFAASVLISLALLVVIMYGIIPGVLAVASKFELLFINGMGLPFHTGVLIYVVALAITVIIAVKLSMVQTSRIKLAAVSFTAVFLAGIWILTKSVLLNIAFLAILGYLIWIVAKERRDILNTALTSLMVILIGYSSFALIVIRSSANPPMNENNPSHIFNLIYYLNRDQYGQRPLFYGQYYNAPVLDYETTNKKIYNQIDGRYEVTKKDFDRVFDERFETFLPRMWSEQADHVSAYKEWGGAVGVPLSVTDPSSGERKIERRPKFSENLRFMFSYQVGFMYFRYFMWNFSGRQNDTQNYGGAVNGNWITGIEFLDRTRVGSSDNMPDDMKSDPARNKYYLLPLLLGIAGLIYQLNKDVRNWWIVLLLFIMTGLAIVVYLNQYPNQPRERDYAFAGSFYAFAIWIGLGVLYLYELLAKVTSRGLAATLSAVICILAVPVLMGSENWDDHNRSGRYLTTDVASNYLNSCAPNAVLFSNGDNDTFPLWYAQEVEGIRTDVRVCNLMLFNTDWYITQMKHKQYDSKPMKLLLPEAKYYDGTNNQLYVIEKIIDFVLSDNQNSKIRVSVEEEIDFIPARTIRIPVNKEKVLANGTVRAEDADLIVPYIDITLKGNSIMKSQLMVLDFLAQNDWERPVYFVTGYHNDAMGLEEYFQLEGNAFRLVPLKSANNSWLDYGRIDTDILYENMINRFKWRGASEPGVYLDHYHKRTLSVIRARYNYARLAVALVANGEKGKAVEVLDYCVDKLPFSKLPHDMFTPDIVQAYFAAGADVKAVGIASEAADYLFGRIEYYMSQRPGIVYSAEYEIQVAMQNVSKLADALTANGKDEEGTAMNERLEKYYSEFLITRRSYSEGS